MSVALKASTSRLFLHISWASSLLAISVISLAAQSASRDIKPVDAVQGIVAAFRQHRVVLIGEAHWLRQAGDLYIDLVRDPAFQETVQTSSSNSRAAIISHCLIDISPVKTFP